MKPLKDYKASSRLPGRTKKVAVFEVDRDGDRRYVASVVTEFDTPASGSRHYDETRGPFPSPEEALAAGIRVVLDAVTRSSESGCD